LCKQKVVTLDILECLLDVATPRIYDGDSRYSLLHAVVCGHGNGEFGTLIDQIHHLQRFLQLQVVVLSDTERVNPNVPVLQQKRDFERVSNAAREQIK
jgi:hypothetical protein